jgi:hypothetical protein
MGPNTAAAINLALQAAIQIQQYQLAVLKANAEGRDVTDAELDAARQAAVTAVDNLEQQP